MKKPRTKKMGAVALAVPATPTPLRLDIGCGMNKKEGFTGLDRRKFPGVDIVHDVNSYPWPFKDNSVVEVHCSHLLEHLDHNRHNPERVRFMNELYRVLIPGGKATIITPHWASNRAYGDFTHSDKPVSEMFFFYLSAAWRTQNAPDNDIEWNPDGYKCNFEATWGYSLSQAVLARNQEYQMYAMSNYKDVCQDTIATLTKA
jgi:SAM-dependent methyltransferase